MGLGSSIPHPEVGVGIGEVSARSAADLVVLDDPATGLLGQFGDAAHVLVSPSGPAVQDDARRSAALHGTRRGGDGAQASSGHRRTR